MRAVVVGGSIAGLSAAHVLQRLGIEALVLEKTAGAMQDRGAGLGIELPLLGAVLGREPGEEFPHIKLRGRAVHGGRPGPGGPVIEPGQIRVTTWQHLHSTLRHGLVVPVNPDTEVRGISRGQKGWEVLTHRGASHSADLVIAADGHRSVLRAHVDATAKARYGGYLLWRGLVAADALDDEVRAQFMDGHLHLYPQQGHHFVAYEVPPASVGGVRRLNWGWYTAMEKSALDALIQRAGMANDTLVVPPTRLAAPDRDAVVARAAAVWPSPWAKLVASTSASTGLFVNAIHEFVAAEVAREPVVLLGDAAHLLSPITGAGAAMAMRDALLLERALVAGASVGGPPWTAASALDEGRDAAMAAQRQSARWASAMLGVVASD